MSIVIYALKDIKAIDAQTKLIYNIASFLIALAPFGTSIYTIISYSKTEFSNSAAATCMWIMITKLSEMLQDHMDPADISVAGQMDGPLFCMLWWLIFSLLLLYSKDDLSKNISGVPAGLLNSVSNFGYFICVLAIVYHYYKSQSASEVSQTDYLVFFFSSLCNFSCFKSYNRINCSIKLPSFSRLGI